MRALIWTFLALMALLPVGGGVYLYAAHNAGREELRELCEKDFEPKVYRKVSAEGYFDGGLSCIDVGCWDTLTDSAYRYIEFEVRDADPWDKIPQDGFYRLSKARQGSGLCDVKILEEMKKAHIFRDYVANGDCVRLERIDAPTAPYGVFSETVDTIALKNLFESRILVRRSYISELATKSVIVERNNYFLFQNSLPVFSSFSTTIGCTDVGVTAVNPNIGEFEYYIHPD